MPGEPDPFHTASLRRLVSAAWAASPARFREDANAEEALALGGYAGRVLVELASNAADAARELGVPARIRIRLHGNELRVANTGSALTAAGVAALSSLRASAKRDTLDSVGHFGVGFTAVVSWSRAPMLQSTTGGVRFDEAATRAEIAAIGSATLDREVALRDGQVPVLRLPWPLDPAADPPPEGYATEVRLPLADGTRTEIERILTDDRTAEDLFWALTELTEIDLPNRVVRCGIDESGLTVIDDGAAPRRYRTADRAGEIPAEMLADRPIEERRRARWHITWALPVRPRTAPDELAAAILSLGGPADPEPARTTVGAPTPTDEGLTLPARLVGTFPVDDTRRRLAAGPMLDYLLDNAADCYLDLVAGTDPADRWELLPAGGFPAGPVDGALREVILRRVEASPLFLTAAGDLVTARDAGLLPGVNERAAALLGQAVPGLLPPQRHGAAAVLRRLGVQTLGWAQASTALAGIEREPSWWWQLYDAVASVDRPPDPEDLADLPIPLTGGRRAIGARGCLLPAPAPDLRGGGSPGDDSPGDDSPGDDSPQRDDGTRDSWGGGSPRRDERAGGPRIDADLARRAADMVPTLRIVDPAAAHPFLERLGARPADADTLLADPALIDAVDRMREDLEDADPDPADVRDLATVVLDLLAAGGRPGRAVEQTGGGRALLGELVLTDDEGQPWPAGELLMPGAALAAVLAPDADRPMVGADWTDRYPTDVLVAAGVRSGFGVRTVTDPQDDRHDLPDLADWLDRHPPAEIGAEDETFCALADLDLIDPDRWVPALQLIAGDRDARACLVPSAAGLSYSGWWLSRNALIDGQPPAQWRLPSAVDLEGLYDPVPADLDPLFARWIGVRTDLAAAAADDPEGLLDRLADPRRRVPPGTVPALTAAVIGALSGVANLDLPAGVRAVTGDVVDAAEACVLDEPWWAQVLPAAHLVPGAGDPAMVAHVLDLPLASDSARVQLLADDPAAASKATDDGWTTHVRRRLERAAAAVGVRLPAVGITVSRTLRVALDGAEPVPVRWWGQGGRLWVDGSAAAAGRAAAWAAGSWPARHRAIAAAGDDALELAEDGLG